MEIPEKTVVVFADIGCPWAHAAVHRFYETRARLGLEEIVLDVRAFPLEVFNSRPTPKRTLDAEIPVAGGLSPDAGWQLWARQPFEYAVTTLPAMESVYAAKVQSVRGAETLDRLLRKAFFGESRTISMRHVILDVARSVPELDLDRLAKDLDSGTFRRNLFDDFELAKTSAVKGSPHFFAPDGSDFHNPGVKLHWEGDAGTGFPVVDEDDPSVFESLLRSAAG